MASDNSGVLDTRSALERSKALFGGLFSELEGGLAEDIVLSIGGVRLTLPADGAGMDRFIENAYRLGGFDVLRIVHEAAVQSAEEPASAVMDPTTAMLADDARTLTALARDQAQRVPESGYAEPARLLAQDMAAEATTATDRLAIPRAAAAARRAVHLALLRASIDRVVTLEETAQRWYEAKLMGSVAADFQRKAAELSEAWVHYQIGDARTGQPVAFEKVTGAKGLVILAKDPEGTVEIGSGPRIQGAQKQIAVPQVIAATWELAKTRYEYLQALKQARQARGRHPPRPVDPRAFPALGTRKAYAAAQEKWADTHPIALAAHRRLIGRSDDQIFRRETVETAIIEAFLHARDTIPALLTRIEASRFFTDDTPAAVTGAAALARPATEVILAQWQIAEEVRRAEVVADEAPSEAGPLPDVFYCPWLQAPFHDRLRLLADVIRLEEDIAKTAACFPQLAGTPDDPPAREQPPSPEELARMQARVAHLRPLFASNEDRAMLRWITSVGTLMARTRTDAVQRLDGVLADAEALRGRIQQILMVSGLVLAPFTDGGSFVLAGVLDALIIGDRLTEDIASWIAAGQFSKIVLDQLTLNFWEEPEVAMMVGEILEAGFEIAGDLVNSGVAEKIFSLLFGALFLRDVAGMIGERGDGGSR